MSWSNISKFLFLVDAMEERMTESRSSVTDARYRVNSEASAGKCIARSFS